MSVENYASVLAIVKTRVKMFGCNVARINNSIVTIDWRINIYYNPPIFKIRTTGLIFARASLLEKYLLTAYYAVLEFNNVESV